MPIDPTYIANLPDTVAMPVMAGFLLSLRNRYTKLDMRSWLAGLAFLFVAQLTWMMPDNAPGRLTLVLTAELLAGVALACYRGAVGTVREFDRVYLLANVAGLAAVEALYGMGVQRPLPYLAAIGGALAVLALTTWLRRHELKRALPVGGALVVLALPAVYGEYEAMAYWLLAAVYGYAAWNFNARLPEKSVGKAAILTSILLLAACYAAHPWVLHHRDYAELANQIQRMQKFLVSVGMLLVMVENQSARNQYLAMHDQLTGIPNRRMLDTSLKNEIAWAQRNMGRLTLVMIDLNGFKHVNDTHGHLAGDHVLHEVSKRLRAHLRATELVARMGGDEFVVVTRSAVSEEAVQTLEAQLRKWIREPIDWDGKRLWIDGSMGSARFPEDVARWSDDVAQDTADKLAGAMLRIADMRMYQQKPSSREGLAELEILFPGASMLQ
jgi:diguanylate cyclase (GGDEF)-like protein